MYYMELSNSTSQDGGWNTCLNDFAKVHQKLNKIYKVDNEILNMYNKLQSTSNVTQTIKQIIDWFTQEMNKLEAVSNDYDRQMSDLEKDRLSDSVTDMMTYNKTLDKISELNKKINYFDRQRIKLGICLDYFEDNN